MATPRLGLVVDSGVANGRLDRHRPTLLSFSALDDVLGAFTAIVPRASAQTNEKLL